MDWWQVTYYIIFNVFHLSTCQPNLHLFTTSKIFHYRTPCDSVLVFNVTRLFLKPSALIKQFSLIVCHGNQGLLPWILLFFFEWECRLRFSIPQEKLTCCLNRLLYSISKLSVHSVYIQLYLSQQQGGLLILRCSSQFM